MLLTLGLAVGLGLATRLSFVFIIVALLLGTAVAATDVSIRRIVPWRRIAYVAAAVVAIALPWAAYRAIVQHGGPLNKTGDLINSALHPRQHLLSDWMTTHSQFFHVSGEVFTKPWRSNFKNQAASETYVEMWGDWLGNFAWSSYSPEPSPDAQPILKDQSYIGLLPTLLAVAGWLMLLARSVTSRRALAPLALVPLIAVGGYLYRSYIALTHDGDLLKALYAVNSAPVWAVCFGLASAWLASKSHLARYGMVILFAIFAVLELRFTMYGIRDHLPIF
jgi:hypothetical protein